MHIRFSKSEAINELLPPFCLNRPGNFDTSRLLDFLKKVELIKGKMKHATIEGITIYLQ